MKSRSKKAQSKNDSASELSSGNVFADLGLADPIDRKVKADLALRINRAIAEQGLSQSAAADQLGIHQPHISEIARGVLRGFSVERLMSFLTRLGMSVEIGVSDVQEGIQGKVCVMDGPGLPVGILGSLHGNIRSVVNLCYVEGFVELSNSNVIIGQLDEPHIFSLDRMRAFSQRLKSTNLGVMEIETEQVLSGPMPRVPPELLFASQHK